MNYILIFYKKLQKTYNNKWRKHLFMLDFVHYHIYHVNKIAEYVELTLIIIYFFYDNNAENIIILVLLLFYSEIMITIITITI